MSDAPQLFDRQLQAWRRMRAVASGEPADFLFREVAQGLADRLAAVNRSFDLAADLGSQGGSAAQIVGETGKIGTIVSTDVRPALLTGRPGQLVVCDEEALPFADASLDLVLSALALHAVNDLPGCLVQIRRALRPDGLFLAALPGGATLNELRRALMDAEIELSGGGSPRVSPFIDVRDAGALLQRAGFALPVSDSEVLTVRYAGMRELMRDLRQMGWTNALIGRSRRPLRREIVGLASEIYSRRHSDSDGRVRATFEIINLSGWAPHESQQKPLRPGSARMRLADALGATEFATGAKASPGPGRDD